MNILSELVTIVGEGNVLTAEEASERSAGIWARGSRLNVMGIVMPSTTEQVSKILQLCNKVGQNIVPHGGLTNLTFATQAEPSDLILSLEKLNSIVEIDVQSKVAIVEAGVVLQTLQEAVDAQGLLYPVDFGARGSAMIGGTISTNAGGIQVLRYGATRAQVLGLEVVLADGRILSSLNKMIKDNAGYDLKQLFIGSEGTLGIITRASLRLVSKPSSKHTAFVSMKSFDNVVRFKDLVDQQYQGTLTSFELIWKQYYDLMTTAPSVFKPPIGTGLPFYVLFEIQGNDEGGASEDFESFLAMAMEQEIIANGAIAYSQSDHAWFWGIREKVEMLFSGGPLYVFDVSLPIVEMENYCAALDGKLKEEYGTYDLYIFGHFGDGNLHIGIRVKETFDENRKKIEGLTYALLTKIGGSITAEHGIGLEKKAWLHMCRSEAEISTMHDLKNLFDPKGILNRNKVL